MFEVIPRVYIHRPSVSTPVLGSVYGHGYPCAVNRKRTIQAEPARLGRRIGERLTELGWGQIDLLNKLPELEKGTLSAMILNNRIASEWSDKIAEALGVEHRWLLNGEGPKVRTNWPFEHIQRADVAALPKEALSQIEGYIEAKLEEHRKAGPKKAA